MDIFIYSDESGVFDKIHNDFYIYGGVILLSKNDRDICSRKYSAAEKTIADRYKEGTELKASLISNKDKGKLFRSLNQNIKFGVIVDQHRVFDKIYESKKTKQRYLDFAYKVGLKGALSDLIKSKTIVAKEVEHVHVYVDEHTTATDGRYELQEGLLNEFKYGTYNWNYTCFFEPLFPAMKSLTVDFCNSAKNPLIRAADIVANRMYYSATRGKTTEDFNNLFLTRLP